MIQVISILKHLGKKNKQQRQEEGNTAAKSIKYCLKCLIGMQATFMLKAYRSDEQSKERWHLRYSLKEMDFSQQDWDRLNMWKILLAEVWESNYSSLKTPVTVNETSNTDSSCNPKLYFKDYV